MFGVAMAMQTFVSDSGVSAKDFCFRMFLGFRLQHGATQGNTAARQQQGLVKRINLSFGVSRKNHSGPLGVIMTSISALSSTSYQSPLQKLQDELQSEVNSGAISSSDQGALSSALNDINSSLQSGQADASSGSTNSSPGDLKSKIDSLIANEVSSGKLTSDQATELQGVFKQAFAQGSGAAGDPGGADSAGGTGAAGHAHHGHHGGHGGTPPTDNSSTTDGTSSTGSASDVLQQFLQALQSSQSAASPSSYGATGASDPGSNSSPSFSALLINYQT
jgi:hypothetical protein